MAPPRFRRGAGLLAQLPPVTLRLLIASAAATLLCVVAANLGAPAVLEAFILRPYEVVPGLEVWKLLSYAFTLGLGPIDFVIGLLVLYFFGAWFERAWGPRRFLVFYLAAAGGAGLFAVLVGLVSARVAHEAYLGNWAVIEALTVAMGILEPSTEIYVYFLLPLKARLLMFLSWGVIALYAIFAGSAVPFVTAIGGALVGLLLTLGAGGPRRLWRHLRAAQFERELRRRSRHLKILTGGEPERKGRAKDYLN